MGQNREPRNKPSYIQLVSHKSPKTIQQRKNSSPSNNGAGKTTHIQKNLTPYTKVNSKCIKYLNIRAKIYNF